MATRFYLPSTGAAPVSPDFGVNWDKTSEADRLKMVRTKISSSFAIKTCSENVETGGYVVLNRQYVSDPIGVHDFTDCYWKMFIRCMEDATKADFKLYGAVRVVSNDGSIVRGEWTDSLGYTEFDDEVLVNRKNDRLTVAPFSSQNGDRIVVEIGIRTTNTKTTLYTATMDFGDNSGTDLPENETETAQYNPWIEFTHDIPGMTPYKLEGVSKDKDGNALGSCHCFLCKDNQDNSCSYIAYVLSDSITGAYSFTGVLDNDAQHFVISWKDDTPHVFDVTDHVLQPVVE